VNVRHPSVGFQLFAAAIMCGLMSGQAVGQVTNSPTYCHQYCVDQNQCNSEFSCYDAGTQSWSNCYDFNYSEHCNELTCGMQWGSWVYDHHIGSWSADDYGSNTCTLMQSYVARRDGEDPCTLETDTEYWCIDEPYPASNPWTDEAGMCCLVYYCWGMTCSEWS
jgi:hypothetical protein